MFQLRFKLRSFLIIAVSAALIAIIAWFSRREKEQFAGPKLYVPVSTLELGCIDNQECREAKFAISNRGSQRLVLNQVDCGCDNSSQKTIVVAPNSSGCVCINIQPEIDNAHVQKMVRFSTNDRTQPVVEFTLKAKVVAKVEQGSQVIQSIQSIRSISQEIPPKVDRLDKSMAFGVSVPITQ